MPCNIVAPREIWTPSGSLRKAKRLNNLKALGSPRGFGHRLPVRGAFTVKCSPSATTVSWRWPYGILKITALNSFFRGWVLSHKHKEALSQNPMNVSTCPTVHTSPSAWYPVSVLWHYLQQCFALLQGQEAALYCVILGGYGHGCVVLQFLFDTWKQTRTNYTVCSPSKPISHHAAAFPSWCELNKILTIFFRVTLPMHHQLLYTTLNLSLFYLVFTF